MSYEPLKNVSSKLKTILSDIAKFQYTKPIELSRYFARLGRGNFVAGNEASHIEKVKKIIETKYKRGQRYILCKRTYRVR